MKGYTFYLEFETSAHKQRGQHSGNVIAVFGETSPIDGTREAIVSVFDHPNSAVAGSSVNAFIVRARCKRISKAKAREIHPALFERLNKP